MQKMPFCKDQPKQNSLNYVTQMFTSLTYGEGRLIN